MKQYLIFLTFLLLIIHICINNYNKKKDKPIINIQTEELKANPIENFTEKSKVGWIVNTCPYIVTENVKSVFEKNNIKKQSDNLSSDSIIHLPCTYDNTEKEINNFNLKKDKENKVFIIHNADQIVAKDYLWKNLLKKYGLEKTLELIPMTYVLYEKNDIKRLKEDHIEGTIYILKKNVQRQEGLKLCNKLDEIIKDKSDYVLVQELLQDPYLINNRKINLRVYVLVVCHKDSYKVYVYNDGFMYYTKDEYKPNSLDFGPNITTGYIDRWVYDVNPLTHQDFREYLDKERELTDIEKEVLYSGRRISAYVFNNIYKLIKDVFAAFYGKIGNGERLYNHLSFQLFGVDVAVDNQLGAKIMEVNKGPDLGSKDKRDEELKQGVIQDTLKIINAVDNKDNNGFIKVLEIL